MELRPFICFLFLLLLCKSFSQRTETIADIRGIIAGNITGDTYSPDLSSVIPGSSSLAFIFDVTGSMWDDLKQVTAGARKILATTRSRAEKPLHDYVLIPFHDPVVGPTIVTSNPRTFTRALKDLYVQGGGDCPEMTITAIREALLISLPGSFIYVFTDARSKDYAQIPEVLQIIQRKQSQVVFVLTGYCEDPTHAGYRAYEKIAATSSGQVFLITKDDVSKVVKFIEVSIQAHKVLLLATDHSRAGRHTWSIPFDPELQEVTISLSGPQRRLALIDPNGQRLTEDSGLEKLLDLENVLIVNIKSPTPGRWRLQAYSSGEHSIRVTGLSTLDFLARFSRKPTFNWTETEFQPVAGIPSYILINATGLEAPGRFRYLRLLDNAGNTLRLVSLSTPRDSNQPFLYTVDPMVVPTVPFYIVIFGITMDNYHFVRASKNAIIQIEPVRPVVELPETFPGYFDYPAEIPCQITSLIPYEVIWSRRVAGRWVTLDSPRTYRDSTIDYLRISEVSEAAEGTYKCFANNSKGSHFDTTFLDVEERPPIITTDGNVTVIPGGEVTLTCHVTSNVAHTISWSRVDGVELDRTRIRKLRNGSLLIRRANIGDEAMYQCTAVNIGGEGVGILGLVVQRPPEVTISPSERSTFSLGSTIRIDCRAAGLPQPTIDWLKGSTYLLDIGKIRIGRGGRYLEIVNTDQQDEAVYTCQASNKAGTDSASVLWSFTEAPVVTIPNPELLVLEGNSATLQCRVNGIPQPRITWSKDGVVLVTGRNYDLTSDGTLTIRQTARSNSGVYVCMGTNSAGSDHDEVRLQVGWIPTITNPPHDAGFEFGGNATMSCEADGFPVPRISWFMGRSLIAEMGEGGRKGQLADTNDLFIGDLNLDDEGLYVCSASNVFQTVSVTAQLSVTGTAVPVIDVGDLVPHVVVGQTIVIPCRIISGNPHPTREWNRRRRLLESTNRVKINEAGSIVIEDAATVDAGPYVCTASNVVGTVSRRVDLEVWVPPSIERGRNSYSTIERNSISIPCVSSGNPAPTVTWRREGTSGTLNNQPGYEVLNDGSLRISLPTESNTDLYSCTASNPAGSDSIKARLVVYLRPRLGENAPDHYNVIVGNSITMSCHVAISNPPPTYIWTKDGVSLTGSEPEIDISNDGRITISSAQLSDTGTYTCVATNLAGSVQRSMDLDVLLPPSITRGPASIKILAGETITLNCRASGVPPPRIVWKRDDVEITEDFGPRFTLTRRENSVDLTITDAQLSDDDDYVCVARNKVGADFSLVMLDVQQLPVIGPNANCIPTPENNQCVATPVESGSLTLTCNATGDPPPTIRWYRDGDELDDEDSNIRIDRDGTLTLFVVTRDDNGQYTCEAENERGITTEVTNVKVHERPEIEGSNGEVENLWVLKGGDIDLTCEADAVPPPVITWYKGEDLNEVVVEEGDHVTFVDGGRTLELRGARILDRGMYKCVATNRVGRTNKLINLDVYIRPSIADSDNVDVRVVNLYDPVELRCVVDGIPFPEIEWFKGENSVIGDGKRIQLLEWSQVLRINSALVTDTSSYKCVVTNRVGDASKFFDLSVHVPPTIRGGNITHTVTLNNPLSLVCAVEGIPHPSVRWSFDDDTLTSRSGLRLVSNNEVVEFDGVQKSDEGTYTCTATNDAGQVTRVHTVIVQVPPSIGGKNRTDVTVTLGGNVTLTCDAAGDPPPTIIWMKDGTPLIFSTNENIHLSEDNRILMITNTRESDRGEYTCVASNDVGDETQTHNLDVLVPPSIRNPRERVVVVEHESVTVHCRVYGHPFPEIRWEAFGIPLVENERFEIINRGQEVIMSNVLVEDAKEYTCTARNSIGRAIKHINLVVQVPAVITFPVGNRIEHTVVESNRYELRCVANGIPLPKITWFKDGRPLRNLRNAKLRDGGRVLLISKANVRRHEGAYECVASNGVGDDSREMSLVVYVPPMIQGHGRTRSRVIDIGRSEILECRIKKGKPTPQVHWYNRDNQEITSSRDIIFTNNKQRMLILNAKLSDVGNYWCEATNVAGKSRKDFNLDVIVPPSIFGEGETTRVSVVLDGDITLECRVTGIPTPEVTWKKEGRTITALNTEKYTVSAGGSRLTLSGAEERDAGLYQCVAVNSAGNASKSFQLDVYLPPSVVDDSIENITVVQNSPATMICNINAFPLPQINWFKNSRPLLLGPGIRLSLNDTRLDILWSQEHDTGLYHCEAVNVAGKQRKYFRLKVHVIPTIFGPPHTRLEHVVGDQIRMTCDYDGVPQPDVTWTMDGEALPESVVVQPDGRAVSIASAEVVHTAIFACNASNVAGSGVKTYDVTVHKPPSIIGSGDVNTVIVNRGDRLLLECLASGSPHPVIVWSKNRRRISNLFARSQFTDNGRYLEVDAADLEDAGKYVCTASNVVGVAKKNFKVEVRVPPRVRSDDELEHRWVVRGNNISMTCEADAVPPPTLRWLVNGSPLIPSPRVRTQQGGRTLFLSFAKDNDAALYTCVATNVAGSSSRDIRLDVYSTPTIPGSDVTSTHDVNRGLPFTLECDVVGHPTPDIEWLKDGFLISSTRTGVIAQPSAGFNMSEDGHILQVQSAALQHTGDYSCRATNQAGVGSKQHQVTIRVPPRISDENSSPEVVHTHVHTPTLLRCSAHGIPSPTIQWLKDGEAIDFETSERYTLQFGGRYLRIPNTILSDQGSYTCLASNPAGVASKDFELVVNVPPEIEGSDSLTPTSVGVPTNQTISLTCVIVSGNPFPLITWWNGRNVIEESPRVRFSSDNQTLEVLESRVTDTGRYRCTAINDAGEDSKSFDVEVQTPPRFPDGEDGSTVDVNEGSPLHIHCKIVAVPMPELTWLKNGRPLVTNNDVYIFPGGRTLQIASAKISDAGRYTCVATNNVGSDEKDTEVTINVPPSIGGGDNGVPEVVRESLHNPFTLQCPISGYPTPTITWYKNGVALDLNDVKYNVTANGQVLTVHDSQQQDSGHYDCRAKNKAGQDSKVFHVNIRVPPAISGPGYLKKIAMLNTAVVMPCDASGTPEPTISWMKDGLPLGLATARYTLVSGGRLLIITQAQTSDTGNFTCVASNVVGQAQKTYEVVTYVAPVLPTTPGDITVSQGDTVTLSCETTAVPQPVVQWTENGHAIDLEELDEEYSRIVLSDDQQVLTINDAQEGDAGRYLCVVSNEAGIESKNFKLSVNVPPTIAGPPRVDVIAIQGSAVTLFCDVYAVPKATIRWMKDGHMLRDNNVHTIVTGGTRLLIGSTDVRDTGSYVCHADNGVGNARKEFGLTVQVPPSIFTPQTEVVVLQGEDETIQCFVSGIPQPEVTWSKNGVEIRRETHQNLAVSTDGQSLTIYRAQLSDVAEYGCGAVNAAGREQGRINVHVIVPPSLYDDDSDDRIDVNVGSPVTMHCNVTGGIPPPSISWLRNGVPLEISNRMQLLSGGKTLNILQTQETDTATYSCVAVNDAGRVSDDFHLNVRVPPTFQSGADQEIVIFEGESVTLDCTAFGTPTPGIAWSKDQSPVNELSDRVNSRIRSLADSQQVHITRSQVSDTGRYTCLALSVAGQANKHFDLKVYERVRISGSDDTPSIVVNVGESFELECDANGVPVPVLTWRKSDESQPLIDSTKVLDDGGRLFVVNAQLSDSGTYTCIATSPAGVAEKDYDVTVNQPPTINGHVTERVVVVGRNVTLECKTDAYPIPQLSWYRNGRELDEHERFLTLINVQVSDAGNYTCTATNVAGTTSHDIQLSVYEPPTIDEGPEHITAIRGDTVKLPCVVRGVPTPRVTWRKGSEQLDVESSRYEFLEEGSLIVEDVDVDDTGRFVCLVSNGAGSERRIIELEVQAPPIIAQGATNVTVTVNNAVTLDCEVQGIPLPTVTWSKDVRILDTSADPSYSLLGTGSLRIASAAVLDTGSYRCDVTNPAGRTDRNVSLFVQVPPSISTGPSKITKSPNDYLRIACDVSGTPTPSVEWVKNGVPLSGNSMVTIDEDNGLVFSSVQLVDDATYICIATNDAGSARHEVDLEVHAHPTILNTADRITVFEGQSIALPCKVIGTPTPTVWWRKGATAITSEDDGVTIRADNSLIILSAKVGDAGTYTCVAQNPAGVTSKSIDLDVYTPARFTGETPQSRTVSVGEPLSISVPISGHPEPEIVWSKNGREIPTSDGTLQIPVISLDDEGLYSLTARNLAGTVSRFMRLIVHAAPIINPIGDQNVVVNEGEQISLDVTVSGKPWPEITWTKDGEEISGFRRRLRTSTSGGLTITNARAGDTGHYIGTVVNAAGRSSVDFEVLVQLPPVITEAPTDIEVNTGESVEMVCAASGVPTPVISWRFNEKRLPGSATTTPGKSRLVIGHARRQDAGAYICEAKNPAGTRMATGFVAVKSPPRFLDEVDGEQLDNLGGNTLMDCPVEADPIPTITWTKDGQAVSSGNRIHQFGNGSLLIYSTITSDAGTYTCIAFNDAGSVQRNIDLVLQRGPRIEIRPLNTVTDVGHTVLLNCVATGNPNPTISWNKESEPIQFDDRITILRNNSLRIIAGRLEDTGEYECVAFNMKGADLAAAQVTLRVHGGYSEWSEYGSCSSSCGSGIQRRYRSCNNPPPANGGRECEEESEEERVCQQEACAIDGNWGMWTIWEPCSTTCGPGTHSRSRECDNPAPQFGGRPCNGDATEQQQCANPKCEVDGQWSNWGIWRSCASSCGEGVQVRSRFCNNPPPSPRGNLCFGRGSMSRSCNNGPCPVNGGWSLWASWSFCSASCGGGTRNRDRSCSDPTPKHGGRMCSGPNRQTENCNPDPCSVNGQWSDWTPWGDCSRSCGGGQWTRRRSCTDPPPRHGGRYCHGSDMENAICSRMLCPVDGSWSLWTDWSSCSQTCGFGSKTRSRLCNNPPPNNNGQWCVGDATQLDRCRDRFCQGRPLLGEGVLFGSINDIPFGISDIVANGTDIGDGFTRITAKISGVPATVGHFLKSQISILTPIYWTMAHETQGAYNGYSLTQGVFDRNVSVEFANGDVVKMFHKSSGVDANGKLQIEVALEGNVPEVEADSLVDILDYTEDYVQTGFGELFAYSSRLVVLEDFLIPYTWKHNISYNESRGMMPYLVEQLSSKDILVVYDAAREELSFQMDVKIGKGDPSDRCPEGFLLDRSGRFCSDENECEADRSPCSHSCINVLGSFICGCPDGYSIGSDGRECEDIDECESDRYICPPTQRCQNTPGSYRCVVTCRKGFKRMQNGRGCEDINECEDSDERVCDHVCLNTVGSYRCECRHGYTKTRNGGCDDINECLIQRVCRSDQRCENTDGGYHCIDDCPIGMEKKFGVCVDINECTTGRHECGPGMICHNTEGGYSCTCPPGYKATGSNPPCIDINECVDYLRSPCPHRCVNTIGSFNCICPPGLQYLADQKSCVGLILGSSPGRSNSPQLRFRPSRSRSRRSDGSHLVEMVDISSCPPGYSDMDGSGRCQDIDECRQVPKVCQHSCRNTLGSYECVCPEGYRVAENGRNCEDIDECAEGLMRCLPNQMCFNKRGSVECVNTPCPPSYIRVSSTGYCLKQCIGPDCHNKPRYGIEYKTVALPFGIGPHQDLVRLGVYTNEDILHLNTRFSAINTFGNPFGIRTENYKGVVFTTRALSRSRKYTLEARATSFAPDGRLEYDTKFIIFISVAAHEF